MVKRLLVSWQHPEDSLLTDGAILVNRAGLRFCDESVSPEREIAVAAQADGLAYLLLDERLASLYSAWPHYISTAPEIAYAYVRDYLKLRPDVTIERSDLRSLAIARGLPPDSLTKTVERFNAMTSSGSGDIARGGTVAALTGSRWVLMGPVKAYFTNSEGRSGRSTSRRRFSTSKAGRSPGCTLQGRPAWEAWSYGAMDSTSPGLSRVADCSARRWAGRPLLSSLETGPAVRRRDPEVPSGSSGRADPLDEERDDGVKNAHDHQVREPGNRRIRVGVDGDDRPCRREPDAMLDFADIPRAT